MSASDAPNPSSYNPLIVIATHNGSSNLIQWPLKSIPYDYAVIDTGSSLEEYERLVSLDIPHVVTPYAGYDTGAYLWAYYNDPVHTHFMFMQDSIIPRDHNFVAKFHELMPIDGVGAVGWSSFSTTIWDSIEQQVCIRYIFGMNRLDTLPPWGIFGPIFYTSRAALDNLRNKHLLPPYPTHKEMAQGMERGWAIAFHRANVPLSFITTEYSPRGGDMQSGNYPLLTKLFQGRL